MSAFNIQFIETVLVVLLAYIVRFLIFKIVKQIPVKILEGAERKRSIRRVINFLLFLLMFILIAFIWGVERKDIFVFITSTLTVIGIAFFAQWSIISNITAGIIVFFSHPIRLGDKVKIYDKDFNIEGKLEKVSWFFIHIITEEGDEVTIPNNILLQKSIIIKSEHTEEI